MAFHADRPIKRSRSPQDSSPIVLTHGHVADALSCSPDHGATLILSKLNASEWDIKAIHDLLSLDEDAKDARPPIERLAMAHNRLSSLPSDFGHLTHLRYINLKHNNFTALPHVLTALTSLEILDLSHNKIATLPSKPDQLINLKVFCLSRNRLTSIPSYIVQFHCLEVFQVDRNPIEWPPSSLVDAEEKNASVQAMKDWIHSLKEWIETHPEPKSLDEPSYFDLNRQESWQYPTNKLEDNFHRRSGSAESSFSFSSIPESMPDLSAARLDDSALQRPPPLQLGGLLPHDDSSPTRSVGSCAASPTEPDPFDGPAAMTNMNGGYDALIQHNRNASYAGQGQPSHRTEILAKMSMPDLRSAKIDFTKKLPVRSQVRLPSLDGVNSLDGSTHEQLPRYPDLSLSIDTEIRSSSCTEESEDKPTPRATYSMAFERHSYFRRLSNFPASITLPQSLLCLVETARSMLFAACQVYQTLDHYIVHVDDRLSVLRKVLEPASSDMLQLIAALDRFDASSRKALPPPAVCRAVVESCRDTAAAFGKVVRVLTLQLQVLTTCDDVRYSRLLLVELYAATAEIACAWKKMLPQMRHVKSLLHMNWSAGHHIPTSETKFVAPLDLSAQALRHHIGGFGLNSISGNLNRTRTVRRHAGSFSSKDVEIGKQLPSYDDPSYRGGGSQGPPQTLRNPRRQATTPVTLPSTQNSPHLPLSPAFVSRSVSRGRDFDRDHSRQGSSSSIHASSLSSSPIIPGKLMTSFELPSNSRIQVDKEALHAIKEAVDLAPAVWNMIEDSLEDILSAKADFREGLNKARAVTKRLADMVVSMQEGDSPSDRKLLREDARLFLKAVVQLSSAVKMYKEAHDVPSVLRNGMVGLTNATEEFAILLHVSSFSPSTPRSFSPIVNFPPPPTNVVQQNDSQLGSSLSRSRSTQTSSSVKVPATENLDGSRSALPAQSFIIPSTRRIGRKDSP